MNENVKVRVWLTNNEGITNGRAKRDRDNCDILTLKYSVMPLNVYHCVKLMKFSNVLGGDVGQDVLKFEAFSDDLDRNKILCGSIDLNSFKHVVDEVIDGVLEEAATNMLSELNDGVNRLIKTELDVLRAEQTGEVRIRRELRRLVDEYGIEQFSRSLHEFAKETL